MINDKRTYNKQSEYDVHAEGEYVILRSFAEPAGSETGDIIKIKREVGEIPTTCTVYSIGGDVPENAVSIGDICALPEGNMRNILHPDVAEGFAEAKHIPEKFILVHYKSIGATYRK